MRAPTSERPTAAETEAAPATLASKYTTTIDRNSATFTGSWTSGSPKWGATSFTNTSTYPTKTASDRRGTHSNDSTSLRRLSRASLAAAKRMGIPPASTARSADEILVLGHLLETGAGGHHANPGPQNEQYRTAQPADHEGYAPSLNHL